MTEPITIELNKTGNFDGTTPFTLTRDDFTQTGGRYYQKDLTGAAGLLGADVFGLFQAHALKLVGVSGVSQNPESRAQVLSSAGTGGKVRDQVQLGAGVQYMVMMPQDRLVLLTEEVTATAQVLLVVNEMSEADFVSFSSRAAAEVQSSTRARFQITHEDEAFVSSSAQWEPTFSYSLSAGKMQSDDVQTGSIPCSVLSRRGLDESILVRVRFANTEPGASVTLFDGELGMGRVIYSQLDPMVWSPIFAMGYDDQLGFDAVISTAPVGVGLSVDIDVVNTHPGDHLSRLWDGGL